MTERPTRATLDRIVDGDHAVLLLEDDAGDVVDELVVDVDELPQDARTEGTILAVTVVDGDLQSADPLPDETDRRQSAAQDRLDRLSSRLDGSGNDEDE